MKMVEREPLDEEFRAAGFTGAARQFPRDDLEARLFAAFLNVHVDQLPVAFRYFPNEATKNAWGRVAEAARAAVAEELSG